MIDEKKIELMKKLQRLAERGVGGEKEGAQKKLQQLMKKYDIEESDLSDDKLEDHEWKYHNDFELRLLKQTIYKVMGKDGLNQMYHYRSGKGKKTIQGVQCTKVQAIQIGIEYEFYCETWKEEHDCCYADTSENRHKIFSRLHSASIRNQIREGAFEVREQQTSSPIPFNGCYIQGRRNVKEKNNEIAQEKAK